MSVSSQPGGSKRSDRPPNQVRYLAVIADGNRRWAEQRELPAVRGYEAGADRAEAHIRAATRLGISEFTIFTFSTENWRRSAADVSIIMGLFSDNLSRKTAAMADLGVRIRFIGRRENLSETIVDEMRWSEAQTRNGSTMTLFVAFNYGGRAELIDAARQYKGGGELELRRLLYAPDMHDPDLLIRTGADKRLSNFMLWRLAYTEMVFRDEMWPDFTQQSFEDSLAAFAGRRRRFGGAE